MTEYLDARHRLEAKIEEMIALLDLLDGDPDLEENGDLEPSLGGAGRLLNGRIEYDLEDDPDLETIAETWSNPMGLRVHVPEELRELRKQGYIG